MRFFSERLRPRPSRPARTTAGRRPRALGPPLVAAVLAGPVALAGCGQPRPAPAMPGNELANPGIDPGSPLGGQPAPQIRLRDQFGRVVSLSQFRGKAVLLAFVDSRCSTICPLTTTSLLQAVRLLGAAGRQVQLVGVNANPKATRVSDVRAYSAAHGMTRSWEFLTGPLGQLARVWKDYHVYVQAIKGNIDHEPAIYLIRPDGREQSVFLTQMAYTATGQQAQVLANAAAAVLPGRPPVSHSVSLRYLPGIGPGRAAALPLAEGWSGTSNGAVTVGRGHAHLVVFFASWVDENSDLTQQLRALDAYQRAAAARGWPQVVAVDEASTESSPAALPALLARLGRSLDYPVAVDRYGQLADGYGVQDQPWIELVSADGKILLRHDGWWAPTALAGAVRAALAGSAG